MAFPLFSYFICQYKNISILYTEQQAFVLLIEETGVIPYVICLDKYFLMVQPLNTVSVINSS